MDASAFHFGKCLRSGGWGEGPRQVAREGLLWVLLEVGGSEGLGTTGTGPPSLSLPPGHQCYAGRDAVGQAGPR